MTRGKLTQHLPAVAVARRLRNRVTGPPVGAVDFGDLRRLTPISRHFGFDRGTPVDRYYIERFLKANCLDIKGRVLEIAEDLYATRYGADRIATLDILNLTPDSPRATIIADLSNAPKLADDQFDARLFGDRDYFFFGPLLAIGSLGVTLVVLLPPFLDISIPSWRSTPSCRSSISGLFRWALVSPRLPPSSLAAGG